MVRQEPRSDKSHRKLLTTHEDNHGPGSHGMDNSGTSLQTVAIKKGLEKPWREVSKGRDSRTSKKSQSPKTMEPSPRRHQTLGLR